MKKYYTAFAIIISSLIWGQNQLPDDGITSEFHKKYMGKGIFSKTEILFGKENQNQLTNKFNWGDPIYGRLYWDKGINNYYLENGWKKPEDTYRYLMRIFVNGNFVGETKYQTDGKRTSVPVCFSPAPGDTYDWSEKNIINKYFGYLDAGDNEIRIEICPYNRNKEIRSDAVSSAGFHLNISKSQLMNKLKTRFYSIETENPNNSDAWKKWKIDTGNGKVTLEVIWDNIDNWKYDFGSFSGEIKRNNDEWELEGKFGNITIQKGWDKGWKLVSGMKTYEITPAYSRIDEWNFQTGKGKLNINTSTISSNKDAWKKWNISDDMRDENPELKLGAIFIAIYTNILEHK